MLKFKIFVELKMMRLAALRETDGLATANFHRTAPSPSKDSRRVYRT